MNGGHGSLRAAAITLSLSLAIVAGLLVVKAQLTAHQRIGAGSWVAESDVTASDAAAQHARAPADSGHSLDVAAVTFQSAMPAGASDKSTMPTAAVAFGDLEALEPVDESPAPTVDAAPSRPREMPQLPKASIVDATPRDAMAGPDDRHQPLVDSCQRLEERLARLNVELDRLFLHTAWMQVSPPARNESLRIEIAPHSAADATALIKIERVEDDRQRFSLQVQHAPVKDVLSALADLAGVTLEFEPAIQGRQTLTLRNVTLAEAMTRVVEHAHLVAERDARLWRVMLPATAAARRPIVTRVYRPQHISVAALELMLSTVLTPGVGRMAISTGAIETDLTGMPTSSTIMIADHAAVHDKIAAILEELDVPASPSEILEEAELLPQSGLFAP